VELDSDTGKDWYLVGQRIFIDSASAVRTLGSCSKFTVLHFPSLLFSPNILGLVN